MTDKQIQKSGEKSLNIQARDITVGMTYSEARQLAQDVFNANFYKLAGVARDVARERADELLEEYLKKLSERNPQALASATDPDMQYALFTAQREYARTGDEDLGDILVDILVDRAAHNQRSLLQIVLNESLAVAAKLTPEQFDILSLIFIIRYSRILNLNRLPDLGNYLRTNILPFTNSLRTDNSCYQHLEYTGCATVQITQVTIQKVFLSNYPGFFWKGMTRQEADELVANGDAFSELIVPCFHDSEMLQFNAVYEDVLALMCNERGRSDEQIKRLIDFQKNHLLDEQKVKEVLIQSQPSVQQLIDAWDSSLMKNLTLTSVGIAVGHANLRRKIGEASNLNIWIK